MESKVYTPEEVLNLQSVAYQKGINEGYKLRKSEQQCAVWVKGVRGFPIKKPVIAKKFISHLNREVVGTASSATGEMICFDWGVSAVCLAISHEELNDLMWLDESAAGRESDAVVSKEVLEFIRDIAYNWDCDEDSHKYNTVCRKCSASELYYDLTKQQKEK